MLWDGRDAALIGEDLNRFVAANAFIPDRIVFLSKAFVIGRDSFIFVSHSRIAHWINPHGTFHPTDGALIE